MKFTKKLQILVLTLSIISCASNKVVVDTLDSKDNEIEEEKQDIKNPEEENDLIQNEQSVELAKSNLEGFLKEIENVKLTIESTPKETIKTKNFDAPFKVKVTKDDVVKENFDILVKYPSSRDENFNIVYTTTKITTDNEGTALFLPPNPTISVDDKITFSPFYDEETILEEFAVESIFKVRTNLKNAGGVIAIVEFKKDGKPLLGNSQFSSKLLINLIKSGFTGIGNDDFTNAILSESEENIFNATKRYNRSMSYLIYGTVKYDETLESNENINLVADVYCMNLKAQDSKDSNLILYKTTVKSSEKNLMTAQEVLSKQLSDLINYGM